MKPSGERRRLFRVMDLAALAVGGVLALCAYSLSHGGPARPPWLVAQNGPKRGPIVPARARDLYRLTAPDVLIAPGAGELWNVPWGGPSWGYYAPAPATDRCLVPLTVNDPHFVVSKGSDLDPRMIVPPQVVGLPTGSLYFAPRR